MIYFKTEPPVLWFSIQKWNPLWWFGNAREAEAPPDYRPTWPKWLRDFMYCYVRNPMTNFMHFIIGIEDKQREGWANYVGTYKDDIGQTGWVYLIVRPVGARFYWRGWLSYSGKWILGGIGWQPSGNFSVKFNIRNSPIQGF